MRTLALLAAQLLGAAGGAVLPLWEPVWQLNRSTAIITCNRSGWFDPNVVGEYGLASFDWSNNRATWNAENPRGCEEAMVKQARLTKEASKQFPGPETKTFVYRNALVTGNTWMSSQHEAVTDPRWEGLFVHYLNGTLFSANSFNGGSGSEYMYDYRNQSARDFFVNTQVNGSRSMANPYVDGLALDDLCIWGDEVSPDSVKALNWTQPMIAEWTAGCVETKQRALDLLIAAHGFSWQLLQPQAYPLAGMNSPSKETCAAGGPAGPTAANLPWAGMRELCNNASAARDVPWFLHVWEDQRPFHQNQTACAPNCSLLPNMQQHIAAFLLARGPYAWMGYDWTGCSCQMGWPYNQKGCAHFWAPSKWAPEMAMDVGEPTETCREVAEGVFERRYSKVTVRLDCGSFEASFEPPHPAP